ncbi:hypothetical protein K0M31_003483 [Melipona bicolor]|uniref:Uncharacterized protein n=1 Tax=Melipona bicolor TaxID=60889 RepID=A0AA40KPL2_9HYME|nr:hypothetical protein K0M31_003483 [Melipona bicolor]
MADTLEQRAGRAGIAASAGIALVTSSVPQGCSDKETARRKREGDADDASNRQSIIISIPAIGAMNSGPLLAKIARAAIPRESVGHGENLESNTMARSRVKTSCRGISAGGIFNRAGIDGESSSVGDLQSAADEIGPAKPKFIGHVALVPLVD